MNEHWAKMVIDHLIKHGVRRFCLSPGSRSTPLAYAVAQNDRADAFVFFDERALGFHALGYSKGSKEAVALIVTSGTAVGNLMPAVMEASHENVPLIVLTADRPPELRDCGSNQACDQVKFFGSYVRWQVDLPCPDPEIDDSFIGSTIAHAVFRATESPPGPVHLNCMFREPFFDGEKPASSFLTHYEKSHHTLASAALELWGKKLSQAQRGVIIAGSFSSSRSLKSILTLAEALHFPILADICSPLRLETSHLCVIPYYDAIVKHAADLNPDLILYLGEKVVSKAVSTWAQNKDVEVRAFVTDHPHRLDPTHLATHRVMCDPSLFCEGVLPFISRKGSWLDIWRSYSDAIDNDIDQIVGSLTEPGLFRYLHHHIPAHYALFIGNSMPIRDADLLFFPRFFRGTIHGKRGLSGIDGNIATAIGIAEGSQRPVLAILGDLTALHDLNALLQLFKAKHPVIFVIINNKGGGIFSFLPIADKKEVFEEFWAGAHNYDFAHIAKALQLPYTYLTDYAQLAKALREEKSCILELQTNRVQNYELHSDLQEKLKTCLNSVSCTVS